MSHEIIPKEISYAKHIYSCRKKKHVLSSLTKRSPLLLHNCAFHSKSEMVWYFIGVYTVYKILYYYCMWLLEDKKCIFSC